LASPLKFGSKQYRAAYSLSLNMCRHSLRANMLN